MRGVYWQELWVHIPSTRKRENSNKDRRSIPHPVVPPVYTTSTTPTSQGLDRGQGRNTPAWMVRDQASNPINQAVPLSDKRQQQSDPWIVPKLARVHNVKVTGGTPILISINNNLPCVDFRVGNGAHHSPSLYMLVDSGAAMNTGHLTYHRSVMAQFPDIIEEYIECGPGTKYDLVHLKVAVTQSTALDQFNDGTLSAIIRYKAPYCCDSQYLILSFTLGDSLSLRTILGTPALEAMHSVLDLSDKKLVLKRLNVTLPLVMIEPSPALQPPTKKQLQSGSPISASGNSSEIIVMATGDGS